MVSKTQYEDHGDFSLQWKHPNTTALEHPRFGSLNSLKLYSKKY
jgi:hypothetical protein